MISSRSLFMVLYAWISWSFVSIHLFLLCASHGSAADSSDNLTLTLPQEIHVTLSTANHEEVRDSILIANAVLSASSVDGGPPRISASFFILSNDTSKIISEECMMPSISSTAVFKPTLTRVAVVSGLTMTRIQCTASQTNVDGDVMTINRLFEVKLGLGSRSLYSVYITTDTRVAGYLSNIFDARTVSIKTLPRPEISERVTPHSYPVVHLIATCKLRSSLSRQSIIWLIEFIQHHISIGVRHIVLGVPFRSTSSKFDKVYSSVLSFVNSDQVSVVSLVDYMENIYSYVRSANVAPNAIKMSAFTLFENALSMRSRALSNFTSVWDSTKFLIPLSPHNNLADIVRNFEYQDSQWCHTKVRSRVVLGTDVDISSSLSEKREGMDSRPLGTTDAWMGEAIGAHPRELVSISVRPGLILNKFCDYIIGLDGASVDCDPADVTCCSGDRCHLAITNSTDISILDQYITSRHEKFDKAIEHSFDRGLIGKPVLNEYNARFFAINLASLRSRGLLFYRSLPDEIQSFPPPAPAWKPYDKYYESVKSAPSISKQSRAMLPQNSAPNAQPTAVQEKGNQVMIGQRNIPQSGNLGSRLEDLPAYAYDFSELFYGALIERKSNSVRLHVTTFMACHLMTRDQRFIVSVANVEKSNWTRLMQKATEVKYHSSGLRRVGGVLTCRIKPARDEDAYEVLGHFVPNGLTPDNNANYLLDILRCPIRDPRGAYNRYRGTSESIEVEILREGVPIIRYAVPWTSRRVGFMMDTPAGSRATTLDSWKGSEEVLNPGSHPMHSGRDKLHMCVPGMQSPLDRRILPLFAEFFEHHYQLGVQHFHLVAAYLWNNKNMDRLLTTFRSYISQGVMSVTSHSSGRHAVEYNYVMHGISYHRDPFKVIFSNMCLYYAKGMADYVAIWDFDEFFIPKFPHGTIMDVVRTLENRPPGFSSEDSRTLVDLMPADHTGHPSCYILLNSEVILNAGDNPKGIWIGEKFSHKSVKDGMSFQKPIFPTDTIFQASLHTGGTCKMKAEHAGCDIKCGDEVEEAVSIMDPVTGIPRSCEFCYVTSNDPDGDHNVHRFDQTVLETDAHRTNMTEEAMLYHIQFHRSYRQTNDPEILSSKNDYSSRFFGKVYKGLVDRGITVLMELPVGEAVYVPKSTSWKPLLPLMESLRNNRAYSSTVLHGGDVISSASLNYHEPLPKFAADLSEYFISGLLERSDNADSLHLTTFLLGNAMFDITTPVNSLRAYQLDPLKEAVWKSYILAANTTKYDKTGLRQEQNAKYSCRIRVGNSFDFTVKGHFIPNRLTLDANANRRVDILRCPVPQSFNNMIPSEPYKSHETVFAEIIRDLDSTSLVHFSVPLALRRTGFMADTSLTTSGLPASRLDAWKGRARPRDDIHMCVPGIDSEPSRRLLSFLVEYLQHHLLLGIEHFHVGVRYDWSSGSMNHMLQGLKAFIDEGQVSVTSMTSDGMNDVYATSGIAFERDDCKVMFVNSCLYYAKGMADYVAVWDFDEYFIPKPPHNSIMDVVRSLSEPFSLAPHTAATAVDARTAQLQWNGAAPGYATADGHALCYFLLNSETLRSTEGEWMRAFESLRWIGEMYISEPERHETLMNFKKSILPTKTIFYSGLHMPGACSLDAPFRGCADRPLTNGFCMSTMPREFYGLSYLPNGTQVEFSTHHPFDSAVMDEDAKVVDKVKEGLIYHIMMHRMNQRATLVGKGNDYSNRFFRQVREALRSRGIIDTIDFPALVHRGNDAIFSPAWTRFKVLMEEFDKHDKHK